MSATLNRRPPVVDSTRDLVGHRPHRREADAEPADRPAVVPLGRRAHRDQRRDPVGVQRGARVRGDQHQPVAVGARQPQEQPARHARARRRVRRVLRQLDDHAVAVVAAGVVLLGVGVLPQPGRGDPPRPQDGRAQGGRPEGVDGHGSGSGRAGDSGAESESAGSSGTRGCSSGPTSRRRRRTRRRRRAPSRRRRPSRPQASRPGPSRRRRRDLGVSTSSTRVVRRDLGRLDLVRHGVVVATSASRPGRRELVASATSSVVASRRSRRRRTRSCVASADVVGRGLPARPSVRAAPAGPTRGSARRSAGQGRASRSAGPRRRSPSGRRSRGRR